MLEFQLTGVMKQQAELATRWFGFDFGRMANSRDAEHQLTVPAEAVKVALTTALAGYTGMSKNSVTWPSVNGLPLPKGDFTVEHWALSPTDAAAIRRTVTWALTGGQVLYYINGSYDLIGTQYWGITLIGNQWFAYDMDHNAINDGQWHHYAITFTREDGVVRGRLYIDGVQRKLRRRGNSDPFNIEYAQFAPTLLDVPSAAFASSASTAGVTEFVVWKGIPGHIGKGKPTTGPIRDTTRPQGQLYVSGSTTQWEVPAGVDTIFIDGIGGGGGGTKTVRGGAGKLVSTSYTVSPGDKLVINPGVGGAGSVNGGNTEIRINGVVRYTAAGGTAGGNTGVGTALYPNGPVLGTGGLTGGTVGYYGAGGGARIIWGEGRPLPVRYAPDV